MPSPSEAPVRTPTEAPTKGPEPQREPDLFPNEICPQQRREFVSPDVSP